MEIFIYTEDVNYDMHMIVSNLGFRTEEDVPPRISEKLKDSLIELKDILKPKVSYRIFPVKIDELHEKIEFSDEIFIDDEIIYKNLVDSDEVVVAAGSIGTEFDDVFDEINKKENKDYLKLIVYDAIGKAVLDRMILNFRYTLAESYDKKDMGLTREFSPGSNKWDLENQRILFKLLGDDFKDIVLTDKCIMKPFKSFSGIYGAGTNIKTRFVDNKCFYCDLTTCIFRNADSK